MSISENIKALRERYSLTQSDLGAIAGVSDKAVSTWEKGTAEPRMGAVQKIADHFGIPKSFIVDDEPKYDPLDVKLIDPREKKLHENYTVLTEENRNTLFSYSTFLRSQQVLQAPAPDANLKAAHYREDIEVTDEMKKHDDDIMNDDDF